MPDNAAFLSCDWGTTTFRIRLVRDGRIIKQHTDFTGCRVIFDKSSHDTARRKAFERHLRDVLGSWLDPEFTLLPLLISGMASSTIGWQEVPYANLPLKLNASNLHVEFIDWAAPSTVGKTYLVSGVASETEMMRGEESEAIGLLHSLPAASNKATLILPGTHSKHLTIQQGAITRIQTFMTGELFEVLTNHSVLRASVNHSAPADQTAFKDGLDRIHSHGLASSLFQTRTRQVLGKKSTESNTSFLSGLLVGAELASLRRTGDLLIGGSNSIRELYAAAAKHLGHTPAHVFSAQEVELAVPKAHELILSRLNESLNDRTLSH